MTLEIAQLGQPVLRQVAVEVAPERIGSTEFQSFLQQMRDTLDEEQGAGLAAPQVFASVRVFLAAVWPPASPEESPGVEVFVNPRLVEVSAGTSGYWEGCLSFPELLVFVERPKKVRMDYLDQAGQQKVVDLVGFPARVVQHELDHLNGVLTIDRASSTRHIIKASEIDVYLEAKKQS